MKQCTKCGYPTLHDDAKKCFCGGAEFVHNSNFDNEIRQNEINNVLNEGVYFIVPLLSIISLILIVLSIFTENKDFVSFLVVAELIILCLFFSAGDVNNKRLNFITLFLIGYIFVISFIIPITESYMAYKEKQNNQYYMLDKKE
ncbi:hypothetical protein [Aliarcobacter butzleri]|uniref:hypothetical protein n=1 Tax=Aliarcobacter butzleri TaxID=28197 RepID=UPI001269ED1F|nr:hypothetical protein [Aliarcobacter butzleri]